VFKVTGFDALKSIREKLKENIIAIEGMCAERMFTFYIYQLSC